MIPNADKLLRTAVSAAFPLVVAALTSSLGAVATPACAEPYDSDTPGTMDDRMPGTLPDERRPGAMQDIPSPGSMPIERTPGVIGRDDERKSPVSRAERRGAGAQDDAGALEASSATYRERDDDGGGWR